MSGSFTSTGKKTNQGQKNLDLGNLLYTKINNLVIHAVPLSNSFFASYIRIGGKAYTPLLHPSLTFTLSHIAIQLNMENNDILIIEYGQYITVDSEIKAGVFSSSGSNSSQNPRKDSNNNSYYYINKDGARITKVNKEKYFTSGHSYEDNCKVISKIIAAEQYGIPYDNFDFNIFKKGVVNGFYTVECDVNNKITLNELINNFRSEQWEAKSYNLATHICQTFGAEVIKILKAVRKNDYDKIRTREKMILPNCMIKALWDNEELSTLNTLGRVPVLGLAVDAFASIFVKKKK